MEAITYLPTDPTTIRTIAEWHQVEWGHLSDRNTQDRIAEFHEQRESRSIPLTLVAWHDERPVGTASLLVHDMDTHPELTPWLGSVYVVPEMRGRGFGTQLCRSAMQEAGRLGVGTLYLFTPDQEQLYARLGWEVVAKEQYRGELETLMRIRLG